MPSPTDLELGGERSDVYRFVERNGPVAPAEVAEAISVDPERFQHHVSILKRDDLIESTEDGKLTVALHHARRPNTTRPASATRYGLPGRRTSPASSGRYAT